MFLAIGAANSKLRCGKKRTREVTAFAIANQNVTRSRFGKTRWGEVGSKVFHLFCWSVACCFVVLLLLFFMFFIDALEFVSSQEHKIV